MYVHLKVKTKQKNEEIKQISSDHFIVSLKQKPERNLANKRIIEVFQKVFKTKKVRIINGVNSPSKLLSVD